MNGRPLFLAAILFLAGILYGGTGGKELLFAAACFGIWNVFIRIRRRGWRQGAVYALVLGAALVVGVCHMKGAQEFQSRYRPLLAEGERASVQGTVYKKEAGEHPRYYLKSCYLSMEEGAEIIPCNQILTYLDTDSISIGSIITVNGTIQLLEPARNEGNFDEQVFYQSQKIDFKFYGERVQVRKNGDTSLGEFLYRKKERVKGVYCRILGEKKAGILSTMVLGDRELLDREVKESYQRAGISHILAISGLHISMIGMGLYRLLQRCGLPSFQRTAASGGMMTIFAMMVGAGVSTKRAVLMFFLLLLANLLGRSYDSLTALGLSAILLLWENPLVCEYSGFQLSFLAVLGANAGGMMIRRQKERRGEGAEVHREKKRWILFDAGEKLKKQFTAAFMIQAFTLPVIAGCYYELPVYVIPVNLLILPTAGILLFLGILGGILGMASPLLGWLPLKMAGIFLEAYEGICRFFLRFPGSTWITGKPGMGQVLLFYLLLALVLLLTSYRNVIPVNSSEFILFVSVFLCFQPEESHFQVKVLDVGQGDGIYIESGTGSCYFVDGGSVDISGVGEYRILPFLKSQGREQVDCWFVSHCDADHVNGLEEVLETDYPVRRLVFSKEAVQDEAFGNLVALAEQRGCEISYLEQGEKVTDKEVSFTALYPGEADAVGERNADSLVLLLKTEDFSGLLTGDIGKEEEEKLAEICKSMEKDAGSEEGLTWYKAAHHGSKESNSEELLQALKPQIATISCGINNSYGHPGKEAVEHMEDAGAAVFDTRMWGQITLTKEGERILVSGWCENRSLP